MVLKLATLDEQLKHPSVEVRALQSAISKIRERLFGRHGRHDAARRASIPDRGPYARTNKARPALATKPCGRRFFWPGTALPRSLQPAAGMLGTRRLVPGQNPRRRHPRIFETGSKGFFRTASGSDGGRKTKATLSDFFRHLNRWCPLKQHHNFPGQFFLQFSRGEKI